MDRGGEHDPLDPREIRRCLRATGVQHPHLEIAGSRPFRNALHDSSGLPFHGFKYDQDRHLFLPGIGAWERPTRRD
jgi:hypothetical protein